MPVKSSSGLSDNRSHIGPVELSALSAWISVKEMRINYQQSINNHAGFPIVKFIVGGVPIFYSLVWVGRTWSGVHHVM